MALQGTYQNPFRQSETLPDAYLKIETPIIDSGDQISFKYNIYFSAEDRDGDNPAQPIFTDNITITDYTLFSENTLKESGKTVRTQIYTYLKSLPEFSTWSDC